MFDIIREVSDNYTIFRLIELDTRASVEIIPDLGAVVHQINLSVKGKPVPLLIGSVSETEILQNPAFNGSRLFPFPNRINKGQYAFGGKTYDLNINFPGQGHAIHGFVYKMPFEVLETFANDEQASIKLSLDYSGDYKGFPFPFKMTIEYIFNAHNFSCVTEVENTGEGEMPMGDGWHPYFSFPGQKADELHLQLPGCSLMEVDGSMIPTGVFSSFNEFEDSRKLGPAKFDTGFRLNAGNEKAFTKLSSAGEGVQLIVWQENYPFLQVYIPPDRQSIAIEPMTCAADAFNNGIGLISLKPGSFFNGSFGVMLLRLK